MSQLLGILLQIAHLVLMTLAGKALRERRSLLVIDPEDLDTGASDCRSPEQSSEEGPVDPAGEDAEEPPETGVVASRAESRLSAIEPLFSDR